MSGVLRRNTLFWLNLLLVIPLAGFTVAGFAGAYWWGFDLFSHFRVQYCAVALLLCLFFLALRARRSVVVTTLLLAINLTPVTLIYLPQAAQKAVAAEAHEAITPQRVLMMNVYRDNPGIQRVLKYVRRENPDVLVLQEISEAWRGPLKGLEARYPFRWVHPGDVFSGMAVFSRSMPVETRVIDLGSTGVPSLLLTLELGPNAERRLSILTAHLKSPLPGSLARERNRQLAAMARVAREHVWPLVVVGDINISPFSPLFASTLRDGGLESCADGLKGTWPAWAPPLSIQIDHCLATEGVVAADFRVGPALGSDHHAILVKLSPAPLRPNDGG